MGELKRLESLVKEMALDVLKVNADSLCVWQEVVKKPLPSELLLFFLLDLVKELKNGNSETLLNLLFDEEHLATRENSYAVQAKIFQSLSDEKSQKDVQRAVWAGLERNVADLPMAHVFHLPDQDLVTLALDVRCCPDGQKVQAYLQAHKGLSWWDGNTALATFTLRPRDRKLAMQAEVWTWQVWLTKVCPVSEAIVLPEDGYLQDKDRVTDSPELQTLVQFLRDHTNGTSASRSGKALLLIFQHVDLDVLSFQQYFRKACIDFLESRMSKSILALVPLDNLQDKSYETVCGLMSSANGNDVSYSVSVRSAFCPQFHVTNLVLLEVTVLPQLSEAQGVTVMIKAQEKRQRGRPKKQPEPSPSKT